MGNRFRWFAGGAVVVLTIAAAVFNASGAIATQGQPVIAGEGNVSAYATGFCQGTNTCNWNSGTAAVLGIANAAGGRGVWGAGYGQGVIGEAFSGAPESACLSTNGVGVVGCGSSGAGVEALSATSNGVYGHVNNQATSGVYGQNTNTSGGYGVAGRSSAGPLGAQAGAGVLGENTSTGVGVWGHAVNGTGVYADSPNGYALQVNGKASFSRSGVATVAGTSTTPKNSVRVTLPITARSMMTATLQKFVSGVFVVAAVPNVTGGYFTIYLNKSVTTSVGPIAWQVMEKP